MRVQLLLLFTLAVLSGRGVIADDETAESKAIQKIELLGGKVETDDKGPGSPVVSVSFTTSSRFNDKFFHLLKPFKDLTSLDLIDVVVTDAGLKDISDFTRLTSLHLSGPEITDEGLIPLHGLKGLTKLTLCGTSVTPAARKSLVKSLPKLRIFDESLMFKRIEQQGGILGRQGADGVYVIQFDESPEGKTRTLFGFVGIQVQQDSKVTDDNLKELRRLRGVKTLTNIGFDHCTQVTNAGIGIRCLRGRMREIPPVQHQHTDAISSIP